MINFEVSFHWFVYQEECNTEENYREIPSGIPGPGGVQLQQEEKKKPENMFMRSDEKITLYSLLNFVEFCRTTAVF